MSRRKRHRSPDAPHLASDRPAAREPAPSAAGWHPRFVLALLLVAVAGATVAAHFPVLSAGALSIDDHEFLTANPLVQNPSWASARRFFAEVLAPSTVEGYYIPLSMVSLMLDHARGGRPDDLRAFHETALALHTLNTILIGVFLFLLFRRPAPAALVALLFGLHPLTVEPVAWIGERKTLLAACFALVCLVLYVVHTRRPRYGVLVAAVVAYLLAVLSKPTATPLPLFLLLLDWWPLRRLSRRAVLEKVPFFIVGAASAVVTLLSHSRTAGLIEPPYTGPLSATLLVCHNVVFYLRKLIWPADLSSIYVMPPLALSQSAVLLSLFAIVALIVVAVVALRRTRAVAGGLAGFVLLLAPTLGLVGYSWVVVSDKYVYLPVVALLVLLAGGLFAWWSAAGQTVMPRRGIIVVFVVGIAVAELVGTRRYLADWRDTVTLFQGVVALAPGSPHAHNHLGYALAEHGDHESALAQYRRALELSPAFSDARYNLARTLAQLGRREEALDAYQRLLVGEPDDVRTLNSLGSLLADLGRFDEAAAHFRRVIELDPTHAVAHYNLGCVLAAQQDFDGARAALQTSLAHDPRHASAHNNLGNLLRQSGETEAAIDHFRQAVALNPHFVKARENLADALLAAGRTEDAVAACLAAFDKGPNTPRARLVLAQALADPTVAADTIARHAETARRTPTAAAHRDHALLLLAAGRSNEGRAALRQAARLPVSAPTTTASIAWLLATLPEAEPADHELALQLATQAAVATDRRSARLLDVLSVAQAAAGRFDEASATAQAALGLAPAEHDQTLLRALRYRLALFERGEPYRE